MQKISKAFGYGLISLLMMCWATPAQTDPAQIGPKDGTDLPPADLTRVKVGEAAPEFTLNDQDGKAVSLSSYRGKKAVVLVFYRGYW